MSYMVPPASQFSKRPRGIPSAAGRRPTRTPPAWALSLWSRHKTSLIGLLLFGLVVWAFLPAVGNGFINLDDGVYVYDNARVKNGLTWENIRWALTTLYFGIWHPLTWISHMLDCQWFGLRPGGHHLTNVLLHAANTALLFVVLRRMTGALWRPALVAALFALHPLHVESVAWVAERKDVLSTFFVMLTLWAYARYAECRRQNAECRMQRPLTPNTAPLRAPRFTFHASRFTLHLLFALPFLLRPGTDEQTDGRHPAVGLAAVGLLAAWENAEGRSRRPATRNPQPSIANRKSQIANPPLNGGEAAVCDGRRPG